MLFVTCFLVHEHRHAHLLFRCKSDMIGSFFSGRDIWPLSIVSLESPSAPRIVALHFKRKCNGHTVLAARINCSNKSPNRFQNQELSNAAVTPLVLGPRSQGSTLEHTSLKVYGDFSLNEGSLPTDFDSAVEFYNFLFL